MTSDVTSAGLEWMRAVIRGEIAEPPFMRVLGMRIVAAEVGAVTFEYDPSAEHYNPIETVHGGVAAALVDSAAGCAIVTTLPEAAHAPTLEMKLNYLRPMTEATGPVRCEGRVLSAGRRTALAEARIVDREERLLVFGTITCMIVSPGGDGR